MSSQPVDTPAGETDTQPTVERGQIWQCNEACADPDDVPDPHDVALWESHPRFRAVVDRVDGSYVELTVSQSNDHPRSPEFGAEIATSTTQLTGQDRWRLVD